MMGMDLNGCFWPRKGNGQQVLIPIRTNNSLCYYSGAGGLREGSCHDSFATLECVNLATFESDLRYILHVAPERDSLLHTFKLDVGKWGPCGYNFWVNLGHTNTLYWSDNGFQYIFYVNSLIKRRI